MKDSLLRARIVFRTSNINISRRCLADYAKKLNCTKKCATRAARLIFLIRPTKLIGSVAVTVSVVIGNLRSYDGNCNEDATLKLNFALS